MALTRPRYSQIYDTDYKQSVRVATTADVGNLLATGNMTNTVDGKLLAEADRILVKDQSDAKQNGIYKVLTLGTGSNGTWIRTTDADANGVGKVTSGMTTTVADGDINISKTYKLSTLDPITIGVTELTFINPFASSAVGTDKQIPFNDGGVNGASANLTFDKSTNTLTVSNAAVLTQLVGSPNVTVSGSMLPSANITYDLGSPTQRWREGWFSGSTIHIGDESISVDNNGKWTFTSDGAAVELGTNTDFNPPSANISGNVTATNYLFANGTPLMTVVNTMISVANTAMKGYADGQVSTLISNAAVQSGLIANLELALNDLSNNVAIGEFYLTDVTNEHTSNIATLFANAAVQSGSIVTANTAMKGYVDGINSTLTSNAAVQAGLIASKANLSGASFTGNISVPYIVGSTVIDGNLNISGNLNVTGVETIFNTNNLVVNDSLIYLADDNTGDVLDIGIVSSFTNPTYQHTGFVRDAGDGVWKLFANVVAEPTTTVDFTNATYSNLRVGNLITSTVTYANGQSILTNVESAITTANTAMKGYVDAVTTAWTANASTQAGDIATLYSNAAVQAGDIASLTANAAVQAGDIATLFANAGAQSGSIATLTANAAVQAGDIAGKASLTGATFSGAIVPNANVTVNLGSVSAYWGTIYASTVNATTFTGTSTTAKYADLAEIYTSDKKYIPGTVVSFGGTKEVTITTASHDPSIAGVISTNPAYLMNNSVDGVAVALQGRVPCRVQGPVKKGDRVVSSDVPGVAQRLDPAHYQPGCIIGKSLEYVPDGEIATIEVVVGRN